MQKYLSSADIAEVCKVTRSAVSNWKRRYTDFPPPKIENREITLYDADEMITFLNRRGKLKNG